MIPISGTVRSAVNLKAAESKWASRKKTNPLSRQEINKRQEWTREDWMKNRFETEREQDREQSKMQSILNKIMNGQDPTPDELDYLRRENPQGYESYKNSLREKEAYEEKLEHCKTKDDVDQVRTETLQSYFATLKKADSNPNLPISAKLAAAREALAKANNLQEIDTSFRQSAEYQAMPTDEEVREAERAEKEEKEAELRDAAEPIEPEKENKDTVGPESEISDRSEPETVKTDAVDPKTVNPGIFTSEQRVPEDVKPIQTKAESPNTKEVNMRGNTSQEGDMPHHIRDKKKHEITPESLIFHAKSIILDLEGSGIKTE